MDNRFMLQRISAIMRAPAAAHSMPQLRGAAFSSEGSAYLAGSTWARRLGPASLNADERVKEMKRIRNENAVSAGHAPLARLSERAAYGELAEQGLSIFDRPAKALDPLRAQWAPILEALRD